MADEGCCDADADASACVSRQYTGTADKVTNCQAGVSLHLASDTTSAAIGWRLFLPKSWDPPRPRPIPPRWPAASGAAFRRTCTRPASATTKTRTQPLKLPTRSE